MKRIIHRRLRWLLVSLLLFAVVAPARAQNPQLTITSIDSSQYPTIKVSISVPQGAPPDPQSLVLLEDDTRIAPNQITATETITVGVAVVALIDTSRSMRGLGLPGSTNRLADAREQTAALARALDPNNDQMAVLTFNKMVAALRNAPDCTKEIGLGRIDGGGIGNALQTCVKDIEPVGKRTDAEIRADPYSYSNLSGAILQATQMLSTTIDRTLPQRQNAIVMFGDSCDDVSEQVRTNAQQVCAPNAETQAAIRQFGDNLSVFAVGLGDENPARAKPPITDDETAYNARLDLLKTYAGMTPDGGFLYLHTNDAAQAGTKKAEFATQVIDRIKARQQHRISITYTAKSDPPRAGGSQHAIRLEGSPAQTTYQTPNIPSFELYKNEEAKQIELRNLAPTPLKSVTFYADGAKARELTAAPWVLSYSQIPTSTQSMTATVVDARSLVATSDGELAVGDISPKPPVVDPNQTPWWLLWLILALVAVALAVGLALLLTRRRVAVPAALPPPSEPVRMTRLMVPGSAPGVSEYALVVRAGTDVGREYRLNESITFIGANPSLVDLVLEDEFVSGRHARIQREGDTLYVVDLDSRNNTRINNRVLVPNERAVIGPNDLLTIGGTTFQWVRRGERAEPVAETPVPKRGNQKITEPVAVIRRERQP